MSTENMEKNLDNFDTNKNQKETIKNLHESLKDRKSRDELVSLTKNWLNFLDKTEEKNSLISSCKDFISQLQDIKKNDKGEVDCNLNGGLTNQERANVGILYLYTALITEKANPWAEDVNKAYNEILAKKIKNEELVKNTTPIETIKVDKIDIPEIPPVKLETDKIKEEAQKRQDQMVKINKEQETHKMYNTLKNAWYISKWEIDFKREEKFNANKIENIIERNLDAYNLVSESWKNLQDIISDAIENWSLENNKKYIFVKGNPSDDINLSKTTMETYAATMKDLWYMNNKAVLNESIKIDNWDGTFTYAQMFESSDNGKENTDNKKGKTSNLETNNKIEKNKNKLSIWQIFPEAFWTKNNEFKKEEFSDFLEKADITLSKEWKKETLEFIFENAPFSKKINWKEVEDTDKLNFDNLRIKIISTDSGNYSLSLTIPDEKTFNIINKLNKWNVDNSDTDKNTLLINMGDKNGIKLKKHLEWKNLTDLQGKIILVPTLISLLITIPLIGEDLAKIKSQNIEEDKKTESQDEIMSEDRYKHKSYEGLKKDWYIIEWSLSVSDNDLKNLKINNIKKNLKKILDTDNLWVSGIDLDAYITKAIEAGKLDNKKEYIFIKSKPVKKTSSSADSNLYFNIGLSANKYKEATFNTELKINNDDWTITYVKMLEKKKDE